MDWCEYKNKIHMNNLSFVLLMPILIDFASVVVQQFGILSSSLVTMVIYAVSLVIIFVRVLRVISARDLINDFLWLILLYLPFGLNYIFFSETQSQVMSQDMLIIYMFFLPISVFSVRRISCWESFFEALVYPGYCAIGVAAIILIFFDYQKYLVYMGFSYALLPFICNFYRMARIKDSDTSKTKTVLYATFFLIGTIIILVFGARAAIGFAALYVIVFELLRSDLKLQYKIASWILLGMLIVLIWTNIDTIANALASISIFKDSYFLKNFLSGRFFESASRTALYEACRDRIATMGFSVSGFFGDRKYCLGYAYPHNIIYEILMSYGWGFGIIAIAFYAWLILKGILSKNVERREVTVFLIVTVFARYFISGSYLIEGRFWIVSALFISLALRNRSEI